MSFELLEVCFFDENNPQSLIVLKSFESFTEAYNEFKELIKTTPCCIILNKEKK